MIREVALALLGGLIAAFGFVVAWIAKHYIDARRAKARQAAVLEDRKRAYETANQIAIERRELADKEEAEKRAASRRVVEIDRARNEDLRRETPKKPTEAQSAARRRVLEAIEAERDGEAEIGDDEDTLS